MKRKIISCLLVLFIVLSIISINNVFADTEVAKIEANLSKTTIQKGEELTVVVSASKINEAIAGIGFTLKYDETLFDFVSKTDNENWTSSKVENAYTILTKNFEATTKTGDIITIKLKAKDTIIIDKATTIVLQAMQLTKDDASITEIANITKNVTIKISNGTTEENEPTNTQIVVPTTNTQIVVPTTNTAVVNVISNTQSNTPVSTNTSSDSKMPQTGEEDYIIFVGIALVTIVGFASYILYRKNRI